MKQNREDIPFEYAHCFATDGQCPQRSGCLHALITELPMKTSQYASNIITAIDPRYIASLHGKGGCTFYRSSDLKRYACGMSRSQKMCTELLHLPQLLLCQPQRQETYLTRRTGGDCIRFPCPLPGVTSHIRQL